MDLPAQSPPVLRWYFRDIVGRRGKAREKKEEETQESKPGRRRSRRNEPDQTGGNYVVEPTVVHIRPTRPWWQMPR